MTTDLLTARGGTGEPIVLVHGLMGRGTTWGRQLPWLTELGEVYTYDAPWHRGRGVDDSEPISTERFVADLADEEATAAAAARLTTLDALVHSAGLAGGGRIADLTREDLRRIFEVNVFAVADLTRLLLPLLRASHDGHVVALNSGSGLGRGTAGSTAYNGSKHALRILTDALREEERGSIRVTSIHPGRTDSDMQRTLQARLGNDYDAAKFIRPEAVAELVRTALETSPEAQLEMLSIRPVITS